jgi:hypothetical protein
VTSAVLLFGCASSATTTTGKPSTAPTGVSTPAQTGSSTTASGSGSSTTTNSGGSIGLGMSPIPGGVPVFGTSLFAIPVAVGTVTGPKYLPALWGVTSGPKWSMEQIGTTERWPLATFELNSQSIIGDRLLVVGQDVRDAQATTPENSFAAVRINGAPWHIVDMDSRVPAGTSIELTALAATGDPTNIDSFFIAVGGAVKGAPAAQYMSDDITGARPISAITVNGVDWNPVVDLPLPAGVSSAEASAVTYCGPGTGAPGVVVAGLGQVSDPTLGTRTVAIVWRSTDNGNTWTVVNGGSLSEPGKNVDTQFVAADKTHIVVVGEDDVSAASSANGKTQRGSFIWTLASDGTWSFKNDHDSLPTGMSGTTTALVARQNGGFLLASQFYETSAGGPTLPGGDLSHTQTVMLNSSPDGETWTDTTNSVTGIDQSAIINGIADADGYDVFMGMDTSGAGASWAVNSASIK